MSELQMKNKKKAWNSANNFISSERRMVKLVHVQLSVFFWGLFGLLWREKGKKWKIKAHKKVLPNSFAKSDGKSVNVPIH